MLTYMYMYTCTCACAQNYRDLEGRIIAYLGLYVRNYMDQAAAKYTIMLGCDLELTEPSAV